MFEDVGKVEPSETRTVLVDTTRFGHDTRDGNEQLSCFVSCRGVQDLVHVFAMVACHNVPRKVCTPCTVQTNISVLLMLTIRVTWGGGG